MTELRCNHIQLHSVPSFAFRQCTRHSWRRITKNSYQYLARKVTLPFMRHLYLPHLVRQPAPRIGCVGWGRQCCRIPIHKGCRCQGKICNRHLETIQIVLRSYQFLNSNFNDDSRSSVMTALRWVIPDTNHVGTTSRIRAKNIVNLSLAKFFVDVSVKTELYCLQTNGKQME